MIFCFNCNLLLNFLSVTGWLVTRACAVPWFYFLVFIVYMHVQRQNYIPCLGYFGHTGLDILDLKRTSKVQTTCTSAFFICLLKNIISRFGTSVNSIYYIVSVAEQVVSVAVDSMLIATPIVGFCNFSMFYCALLYVHSSFVIILMGKRELIALLCLPSWCLVIVVWLFLTMPLVCLQFVIVVFSDHTHSVFLNLTFSETPLTALCLAHMRHSMFLFVIYCFYSIVK